MSAIEYINQYIAHFLWEIWDTIFRVPLISGPDYNITGGSLLAGLLFVDVAIWIFHYFRNNTHGSGGGKAD